MTPAVSLTNVTKAYKGSDRAVLASCDMTVRQGEIYGFLGPNGAGKTTALKLMLGLLAPTAGAVRVLGMDPTRQREAVLRATGSMIEVPVFWERLSARANLEVHLAYMGLGAESVGDTLDLVGLPDTGDQPVSTFSLGMRQRLGLARALVHRPKLLLLDEPINGLDPTGIKQTRQLLLDLAGHGGMTIVMSSHIISEVEQVADTIGVIAEGTIVREVELATVRNEHSGGLEDYFFSVMSQGGVQHA
jgi:ABC-2 type transport system ATP-binding protein